MNNLPIKHGTFVTTGPAQKDSAITSNSNCTFTPGFLDENNNGVQDKWESSGKLTITHCLTDNYNLDRPIMFHSDLSNPFAYVKLPKPSIGETLTCQTHNRTLNVKIHTKQELEQFLQGGTEYLDNLMRQGYSLFIGDNILIPGESGSLCTSNNGNQAVAHTSASITSGH